MQNVMTFTKPQKPRPVHEELQNKAYVVIPS
jgi:hypothetical protein